MLTEYHGDAVAGGTFPALIWKSFMERALAYRGNPPQDFPSVSQPFAVPKQVVYRNGQLQLDNGNCNNTKQLLYFEGEGPARTAKCKLNEVEVPRLVGQTVAHANSRLAAQPLTPQYVYKPAKPESASERGPPVPRTRDAVLLRQGHARAAESAARVVPRLIGLRLGARRPGSSGAHGSKMTGSSSPGAKVIAQIPGPGRAAGRGLDVTLFIAGG